MNVGSFGVKLIGGFINHLKNVGNIGEKLNLKIKRYDTSRSNKRNL